MKNPKCLVEQFHSWNESKYRVCAASMRRSKSMVRGRDIDKIRAQKDAEEAEEAKAAKT